MHPAVSAFLSNPDLGDPSDLAEVFLILDRQAVDNVSSRSLLKTLTWIVQQERSLPDKLSRYWMKLQMKLDRALEAYVRINHTAWQAAENEKDRKKESDRALAIIKAAKDGEGDADLVVLVETTLAARAPADRERKSREANMAELAAELPVFPWVESVPGFGALGFATILALTGDLSNYATVGKVWRRLMLAPYDGCAGSTWQRETWRPRTLSKEEWIANPFSGERYALIAMIADSLHKKQIRSKAKSETKFGEPLGPYGAAYVARREHTAVSHPDWSLMHSHRDALRVMVKALVKDLWIEWRATQSDSVSRGHQVLVTQNSHAA